MLRARALILAPLLLCACPTSAPEPEPEAPYECTGDLARTWEGLPPLITPRQNAAAVALDGAVYVLGGLGEDGALDSVERFDPQQGAWEEVAPMPAAGCCFAAIAASGRAWIFGGYDSDFEPWASVASYDPGSDSWALEEPMPTARANAAAVTLDGGVLLLGGRTAQGVTGIVERLDPDTGTWQGADFSMSAPREAMGAASGVGALYLAGGATDEIETAYGMTTAERFDSGEGTWEELPSLLVPRVQGPAAMAGGCLVVAGGWSTTGETAAAERLDSAQGAWVALPDLSVPRAGPAAASLDGDLFVVGGWQYQGPGDALLLGSAERLVPTGPGSAR